MDDYNNNRENGERSFGEEMSEEMRAQTREYDYDAATGEMREIDASLDERREFDGMSGSVLKIESDEEFDRIMSNGVSLVEFGAKWCGPCRATCSILDALAQKFAGKATIAKVDVDSHQKLATQYGVSSVPSIFVFDDGEIVDSFVGLQTEKTLADSLEKTLTTVGV